MRGTESKFISFSSFFWPASKGRNFTFDSDDKKSIGKKNYIKDFQLDNINSLKRILLLDAQLPEILKEIEESKILRNKSISEICHSKETKVHFLELFLTT